MHMTLEADYAVRIVHCLATGKGRMDAKTIAEQTSVTTRFALKILRKLVARGFIKSYKGTQGGYEMAMRPEDITLGEVIETVEGPYQFSRCLDGDYVCPHHQCEPCGYHGVYNDITEMVRNKLYSVRISDMK